MSDNNRDRVKVFFLIFASVFLFLGCGTTDDGDGDPGGSVGGYAGNYEGTWGLDGLTVGTWTATVDAAGNVTGSGDDFIITGSVSGSGVITFTGTTQDSGATTATFVGSIDISGHVEGTWTSTSGDSGTFTGDRVIP